MGQRKALSSMRDLTSSLVLLHSSRDIYQTCSSLTACLCRQTVWGDRVKKRVLCAEWLLYFKSRVSRAPHWLPRTGKPFPWCSAAHCIPGQGAPGGFELWWDVDRQGIPRCDFLSCVLSHNFAPRDFYCGLSVRWVTKAAEKQVLVMLTWDS